MSLQDDIVRIRREIADLTLRLNTIRAIAGGHDLLSATHGDTLADAVQAGDVLYGNSTPAWARRGKQNDGDVFTLVSGYPDWKAPAGGAVTEADLQFLDEFADASRHWAWWDQGLGAGKTITESGGVLTIAGTAGTNCDWWVGANNNPKAVIGFPGLPCEIITKLNSYTVYDQTFAGLFLARFVDGNSPQADTAIYIGRLKNGGFDGYAIESLGGGVFYYASPQTLPVWLRIRLGLDSPWLGIKADFSYSTDGITYTVLYTSTGILQGSPNYFLVSGLCIKSWGALNGISAPFEFFKMLRSKGPG
jgi:hypothetical protein